MGTDKRKRSRAAKRAQPEQRIPARAAVTGRERAHRTALDGEERFRLAVESFLDAFVIYSSIRDADDRVVDFRVEYVNRAACELTGRRREDYVGKTVLELYPGFEATEFFRWYVDAADNGRSTAREGIAFDTAAHNREGIHYYDVRVAPLEDGFTASWRDATERLAAEEALRAAKDELEERVRQRTAELDQRTAQLCVLTSELTLAEQRERRRLAQVLHDDLQQLLAGAKYHLHSLRHTGDEKVKGVGSAVENLLDQALDCCRSLAGELSPPILQQAGLVAALEWLAGWMRDKHGFEVELEAPPDAVPQSEDMTLLLYQATRELLFNAVKHAGVQGARVLLRSKGEDHLELEVADRGVGFDPQVLLEADGRPPGFGLLSIRERLELFGGRLEIDSAPGRGSRFVLFAPRRSPADADAL